MTVLICTVLSINLDFLTFMYCKIWSKKWLLIFFYRHLMKGLIKVEFMENVISNEFHNLRHLFQII
ncbi:hypothetical protein NQ314_005239 [Rhamnusium bicolor]|uniref:Uncharacterized protein n=1 Tax=Rhamnusium bicolor TaxID=1586634 RepID=A0AAV8ZJ90_9CUCU|nr:hypothetical protein NQ314_005239 [Rhamnusium bicolor]